MSTELCDNCEEVPVAVKCPTCDESYCQPCDDSLHTPAKLAGHKRIPISNSLCENCDEKAAAIACATCDESYCVGCDAALHKPQSKQGHVRKPIGAAQSNTSPSEATSAKMCDNCEDKTAVEQCADCPDDENHFCADCSKQLHTPARMRSHQRSSLGSNLSIPGKSTRASLPSHTAPAGLPATPRFGARMSMVVNRGLPPSFNRSRSASPAPSPTSYRSPVTPRAVPSPSPRAASAKRDSSDSSSDEGPSSPLASPRPASATPSVKAPAFASRPVHRRSRSAMPMSSSSVNPQIRVSQAPAPSRTIFEPPSGSTSPPAASSSSPANSNRSLLTPRSASSAAPSTAASTPRAASPHTPQGGPPVHTSAENARRAGPHGASVSSGASSDAALERLTALVEKTHESIQQVSTAQSELDDRIRGIEQKRHFDSRRQLVQKSTLEVAVPTRTRRRSMSVSPSEVSRLRFDTHTKARARKSSVESPNPPPAAAAVPHADLMLIGSRIETLAGQVAHAISTQERLAETVRSLAESLAAQMAVPRKAGPVSERVPVPLREPAEEARHTNDVEQEKSAKLEAIRTKLEELFPPSASRRRTPKNHVGKHDHAGELSDDISATYVMVRTHDTPSRTRAREKRSANGVHHTNARADARTQQHMLQRTSISPTLYGDDALFLEPREERVLRRLVGSSPTKGRSLHSNPTMGFFPPSAMGPPSPFDFYTPVEAWGIQEVMTRPLQRDMAQPPPHRSNHRASPRTRRSVGSR